MSNPFFYKETKIKNERQAVNLGPTYQVVGSFRTPAEVEGNRPDMGMVAEVRSIMGYRTNITVLAWWEIFPVRRWWNYAIQATKYLAKGVNYKYFLKCLLSVARQDKTYQKAIVLLKELVAGAKEQLEKVAKPVYPICPSRGECSGCETCWPLRQQYQRDFAAWLEQRQQVMEGLK